LVLSLSFHDANDYVPQLVNISQLESALDGTDGSALMPDKLNESVVVFIEGECDKQPGLEVGQLDLVSEVNRPQGVLILLLTQNVLEAELAMDHILLVEFK
jgi:hypothetical protein